MTFAQSTATKAVQRAAVLCSLILVGCKPAPSTTSAPHPPAPLLKATQRVVELPSPNSYSFTEAEVEAKKHLIFSNSPSPPLRDWKNPYFGLAIHVDAEDRLTAYALTGAMEEGVDERAQRTVAQIQGLESRIIQFGNPHGVLITSDRPLQHSTVIHDLLKFLFVPRIQIFYVAEREESPP